MPLSEHEQRLFEQIERSLAEDPKFASAVRSTDPRSRARRRILLAAIAVLLGLAVVVFGVADKNPLLGVTGFVVMLAAAAFGIQSLRRGRNPQVRAVDGAKPRRGSRRSSLLDRLEDRWRNRPEGERN